MKFPFKSKACSICLGVHKSGNSFFDRKAFSAAGAIKFIFAKSYGVMAIGTLQNVGTIESHRGNDSPKLCLHASKITYIITAMNSAMAKRSEMVFIPGPEGE